MIDEGTRPPDRVPPQADDAVESPLRLPAPIGGLAAVALVLVAILALREVASLVVPILFGVFLALVASPLPGAFERRGANRGLALSATIGLVLLVVLVAVGIVALSIAELVVLIPAYEQRLGQVIESVRSTLAGFGIAADPEALPGMISPGALASLVQSTAGAVSRTAGAIFVLAFTLVYALVGARSLEARAVAALGERHRLLAGMERFGADLRRYLLVRAQLGIFAAVLVFALLLVLGVPLPALWAFLVFAASFIPNIGTFIALVPPTILALLDTGFGAAVAVVAGFTLVNFAQDYLLQPRMMGVELNLSPLVVFISIVAWTWVLGAAGALLAVPLTVALVSILEAFPESRALAALMRNEAEHEAVLVPEARAERTGGRGVAGG